MCAACGVDRCENADLKDITWFENLCYDLAIAMNLLQRKGQIFFPWVTKYFE